ncbi:MAG: hypothetical protein ABSF23_16855 [Terracidiphilus sp.]
MLGAIFWLVCTDRADLGLSGLVGRKEGSNGGSQHLSPAAWRTVDRAADGFNADMPAGVTRTQIPAYHEQGVMEPVQMIQASIDPETTYAVAWAEIHPVERAGTGEGADKTLDMARDGALGRTQTTLIGESRGDRYGYPSRDFSARNANGGVLNARLVLAGTRLCLLVATFPNTGTRRDDDLNRFFASFSLTLAARPSQRTE